MPEGEPEKAPKPKKWIADRFEYLDTVRVKCSICGEEMDCRAGRAYKHWTTRHGESPAPEKKEVPLGGQGEEGRPLAPVPDGGSVARPADGGGAEAPAERAQPLPPVRPREPRKARGPAPEPVKGSRDWAIGILEGLVAHAGATPEQKIKALDLLKEYQNFGSSRLDDEKEAEASRQQWERVLSEVEDLRDQERVLLKDPSVRKRVMEVCREVP